MVTAVTVTMNDGDYGLMVQALRGVDTEQAGRGARAVISRPSSWHLRFLDIIVRCYFVIFLLFFKITPHPSLKSPEKPYSKDFETSEGSL